jgi:hypothetical protein
MAETYQRRRSSNVRAGKNVPPILSYGPSHLPRSKGIHPNRPMREMENFGQASMALKSGGLGRNISLKSPFDQKDRPIGFPQHL